MKTTTMELMKVDRIVAALRGDSALVVGLWDARLKTTHAVTMERDEIARKDVRIGDTVRTRRGAGGVEVVSVVFESRTGDERLVAA